MKLTDLISSIFFLVLAAAVVWGSSKLPFGSASTPQTGFFPLILSILLIIFSLILLKQVIQERDRERGLIRAEAGNWKKILLVLGALFIYSILLEHVGYLITTFLLIAFLSRAIWPQSWRVVILLAFLSTLVTYLIFGLLLGATLPAGMLG